MSGKIKNRSATNADSISGGVSCDERILRDCHQMYTDPDSGELADIKFVGFKPSFKIAPTFIKLLAKLNQRAVRWTGIDVS